MFYHRVRQRFVEGIPWPPSRSECFVTSWSITNQLTSPTEPSSKKKKMQSRAVFQRFKDIIFAARLGLENLFRTLEDPQKTTDAFVESSLVSMVEELHPHVHPHSCSLSGIFRSMIDMIAYSTIHIYTHIYIYCIYHIYMLYCTRIRGS